MFCTREHQKRLLYRPPRRSLQVQSRQSATPALVPSRTPLARPLAPRPQSLAAPSCARAARKRRVRAIHGNQDVASRGPVECIRRMPSTGLQRWTRLATARSTARLGQAAYKGRGLPCACPFCSPVSRPQLARYPYPMLLRVSFARPPQPRPIQHPMPVQTSCSE